MGWPTGTAVIRRWTVYGLPRLFRRSDGCSEHSHAFQDPGGAVVGEVLSHWRPARSPGTRGRRAHRRPGAFCQRDAVVRVTLNQDKRATGSSQR